MMSLPVLMIVDDEFGVRESLKIVFNREFRLLEADSVDSVLGKLQTEKPDVVLLDVLMPKTDGIEVLKQIKIIYPDCAVIMLTALNTRQLAEAAISFGAVDVIGKPFDIPDLRSKVTAALAKNPPQSQPPPPQS